MQTLVFALSLPAWILLAKLYGLYDRDEQRTDHTTVDDIVGVFHFIGTGVWFSFAIRWLVAPGQPDLPKLFTFWLLALALVTGGRSVGARRGATPEHRLPAEHADRRRGRGRPDDRAEAAPAPGVRHQPGRIRRRRSRRSDARISSTWRCSARPTRLPDIVRLFDVERVIVAFSNERHERDCSS